MVKKSGWFLVMLIATASCLDEPECFSLNNNVIGVSFRKMSNRQADTLYLLSVTAPGKTDSLFVGAEGPEALTGLDMPLNFYEDTTDFVFTAYEGIYPFQAVYNAKAQFVSEECGERYVLSDLRINTSFDSVRLLNTEPKHGYQQGNTLEIYTCPRVNEVKFKFSSTVVVAQVLVDNAPTPAVQYDRTVSFLRVPLNATQSQSKVTVILEDGTSKEITLQYSRTARTFFNACGEQTILHDLTAIESTFTTVAVLNDSIQDSGIPNIALTY